LRDRRSGNLLAMVLAQMPGLRALELGQGDLPHGFAAALAQHCNTALSNLVHLRMRCAQLSSAAPIQHPKMQRTVRVAPSFMRLPVSQSAQSKVPY
jgi:hypothetical protein